jgi:hypothetical protein
MAPSWAVRDLAASVLAQMCERFSAPYHNVQPQVGRGVDGCVPQYDCIQDHICRHKRCLSTTCLSLPCHC